LKTGGGNDVSIYATMDRHTRGRSTRSTHSSSVDSALDEAVWQSRSFNAAGGGGGGGGTEIERSPRGLLTMSSKIYPAKSQPLEDSLFRSGSSIDTMNAQKRNETGKKGLVLGSVRIRGSQENGADTTQDSATPTTPTTPPGETSPRGAGADQESPQRPRPELPSRHGRPFSGSNLSSDSLKTTNNSPTSHIGQLPRSHQSGPLLRSNPNNNNSPNHHSYLTQPPSVRPPRPLAVKPPPSIIMPRGPNTPTPTVGHSSLPAQISPIGIKPTPLRLPQPPQPAMISPPTSPTSPTSPVSLLSSSQNHFPNTPTSPRGSGGGQPITTPLSPRNKLLMEGYLTKKGHATRLMKDWKKRYFVLTQSRLIYYKTKEDYQKDGDAKVRHYFHTLTTSTLSPKILHNNPICELSPNSLPPTPTLDSPPKTLL